MLESVIQLIGVLFIFVFVLALTYYTTKLTGKIQTGYLKGSNIKIIETFRLNNNKYIQIIQIADKCLAIAVSKDHVELLAELDETQLRAAGTGPDRLDFKEIFHDLIKREKKDSD